MRMLARRRGAAMALLALLAACATRVSPPPSASGGPLPSAAQAFDALEQRRASLRSLRAMARLRYTSADESRTAKQLVLVERADRLRFEILSPFGAVFVLTAADGALAAWTRSESTVYRGTASAENLQRYAQIDLPVASAVDLLLGTPPLAADVSSVISADGAAVELWQDTGRDVRVAWFTPSLEPLRYEQRDAAGRVLLRATFAQYATIDGQRVPTQLTIEDPSGQRRVDIDLTETEVNPVLADGLFALETPAGSKQVDLDREPQMNTDDHR
jgi:outer membrane lipoprotein-sorting protein